MFDIIFLDKYGALASASIYALLLLVILLCNRERVINAIQLLMPKSPPGRRPLAQRIKTSLLALTAMGLLFAVDQFLVNLLGHGRG